MISHDDLMVGNGLVVGDLVTVDDCDTALIELDTTIALLLSQVDEAAVQTDPPPDPDWLRRLKLTLKLRRVARIAVQKRRSEMRRDRQMRPLDRDVALLGILKGLYPAEYSHALDVLDASEADDRGG